MLRIQVTIELINFIAVTIIYHYVISALTSLCVCWITRSFHYFRCKYANHTDTVNTQIDMLTSIHVRKEVLNGLHFTYGHNYCIQNLSPIKVCNKGKRKGTNSLLHDENSIKAQYNNLQRFTQRKTVKKFLYKQYIFLILCFVNRCK